MKHSIWGPRGPQVSMEVKISQSAPGIFRKCRGKVFSIKSIRKCNTCPSPNSQSPPVCQQCGGFYIKLGAIKQRGDNECYGYNSYILEPINNSTQRRPSSLKNSRFFRRIE